MTKKINIDIASERTFVANLGDMGEDLERMLGLPGLAAEFRTRAEKSLSSLARLPDKISVLVEDNEDSEVPK